MTDAEAAAWHGRTVRLMPALAVSEGTRCNQPSYATRSVSTDSLMATAFKLRRGSLAPLATLDRVTVLEVSCGGTPWAVMGGQLILFDADRALAPWDGVFFELERHPDFRAAGQEPFWRLGIVEGREIRFSRLGEVDVLTPVPRPAIDSAIGARIFRAVTEASDLRVVITPSRCSDVMSGMSFEFTVTVTFNGRSYRGCGGPAR